MEASKGGPGPAALSRAKAEAGPTPDTYPGPRAAAASQARAQSTRAGCERGTTQQGGSSPVLRGAHRGVDAVNEHGAWVGPVPVLHHVGGGKGGAAQHAPHGAPSVHGDGVQWVIDLAARGSARQASWAGQGREAHPCRKRAWGAARQAGSVGGQAPPCPPHSKRPPIDP